jgi:hypothetical protein
MADSRTRHNTSPAIPRFADLRFGRLDAHDEASQEPDLLLDGFYDFEAAAAGIAAATKFLLLGTKGAGKSAVLEHLRLSAAPIPTEFFDIWDLREFPLADVRNVKMGQSPGLGRTQNSWEFLLLLRIVDSLYEDQAVVESSTFARLRDALVEAGLLARGWRTRVLEWSKATVKVTVPFVDVGVDVVSTPVHLFQVVEILKNALPTIEVPNPHVIALDGLDSFLLESDNEWESLTGLVQATESVNRFFRSAGLEIGVVVALRSDIFNVLSSAETNKFREYAVELNWSETGASASSPLWALAEGKARVGNPGLRSLADQYLQTPVPISGLSRAKRGRKDGASELRSTALAPDFILEHTRFLPRDLVALLKEIQQAYDGPGPIPGDAVLRGIVRYCETYFEGEVFNNLAGVLPRASDAPRKVAAFRDAMRTVESRFFTFEEVQAELDGHLTEAETTNLLRQMFEVGSIGVRTGSGPGAHTDFVYRKLGGSGFTRRHGFVLHNALTRAWNRPWR